MTDAFIHFFAEHLYAVIVVSTLLCLFAYFYYLYADKKNASTTESRKQMIFTDEPWEER